MEGASLVIIHRSWQQVAGLDHADLGHLAEVSGFSSSLDAVNTPTSSRLEGSVDDSILSITINALLMIAYLPTLYFGHFFPIKYYH